MTKRLISLLLLAGGIALAQGQSLLITEFMAINQTFLPDENGSSSDWIEIHNPGATAVDLGGWFLTDSANNLTKWRFPSTNLPPRGFMIVWASGKNRATAGAPLHTSFSLSGDGEFLGLVRPDGQTVASSYAPSFPAQLENISYGFVMDATNILAGPPTFLVPTPGAANTAGTSTPLPPVEFSLSGGTFVGGLSLSLGAGASNATIFYTLDGSVPRVGFSRVYIGTLELAQSAIVTARAIAPGRFESPLRSETYIVIATNLRSFTSDLPLLVVDTFSFSASSPSRAMIALFDSDCGGSSLTNAAAVVSAATLLVREPLGPKNSFDLEFIDELYRDRAISVLGMPSDSEWVLDGPLTFNPNLINNPFVDELSRRMGRYAPRTRFVELFLVSNSTPVETNAYHGIYLLTEKVKVSPDRVAIDKLLPTDISGGYLFRTDPSDPPNIMVNADLSLFYEDPIDPAVAQQDYVNSFLRTFLRTLTNAIVGPDYVPYIDVEAWIDHHLLNVLAFNVDSLRTNTFLYKPRGGRLTFGPVWNFSHALGSTDGRDLNPRTWRSTTGNLGTDFFNSPWWGQLFSDPEFWQGWIDRYQALRQTVFSTNQLYALMDTLAGEVAAAQPRDQARWPENAPRRTDGSPGGTYATEIQWLKSWLASRLNFMDTNFLAAPILSDGGGKVPLGFVVTISPPLKPGSQVYFTLNGTDPRLPGGAISPIATRYTSPVLINANARVVARSFNPNHSNITGPNQPPLSSRWSGRTEALFAITVPPIAITEIMYHPGGFGNSNNIAAAEFIELKNNGTNPIDLAGFQLRGGIFFTFPSVGLPPGERIVVVDDYWSFINNFGNSHPVAGTYNGSLANEGEQITLLDPLREPILDFTYSDDWYPLSDGRGFSLVLRDENAAAAAYGNRETWRVSSRVGGSPGELDGPPAVVSLVINEVLSHSVSPFEDVIELFNPGAVDADISGWYLSDDFSQPRRFRFPIGTTVPAHDYLAFDEHLFNADPAGFSLKNSGEEIYLFSATPTGELGGYVHGFQFRGLEPNVTFGRIVNSLGEEYLVPQTDMTFAASNARPRIGPVVISEIMFHPPERRPGSENTSDEFIELCNITDQPVSLFAPDVPAKTWILEGAVTFMFPTNVVLDPGQFLVLVGFDPNRDLSRRHCFLERYGSTPARILGPWDGSLPNGSGTIELLKPFVDPDTNSPPSEKFISVDQLDYSDRELFAAVAGSTGLSLTRLQTAAFGNEPTNWVPSFPGPGRGVTPGAPPVITSQPQSQQGFLNQDVDFSVAVTGLQPIIYQWFFNRGVIPGATNVTLQLKKAQPEQAGTYAVLAVNPFGAVLSSDVLLTVTDTNITIVSQPRSVGIPVISGTVTNVTLMVSATGAAPLRYQWRFNGVALPGANNATLLITNVQNGDLGVYEVVVFNDTGSVFSNPARLFALDPPIFVEQPESQEVLAGGSVTFRATISGNPPPFGFRWRHGGFTVANFVLEEPIATLTLTHVQPAQAGSYTVVVTNAAAVQPGVISDRATLTVLADDDHDGMSDLWETMHGFNPADPSDANLDADLDGLTNAQEYAAGTDPNDPQSYLKVDAIQLSTGTNIVISFQAVSNRSYSLIFRDPTDGSGWNRWSDVARAPSNRVMNFILPVAGPDSLSRIFRLITPRSP